jgi:hypothetical protein
MRTILSRLAPVQAGLLWLTASCLVPVEGDEPASTDESAIVTPPTVIATGQTAPLSVVVDAHTAYWVDAIGFGEEPGNIMSAPKAGGGPVQLFEEQIPDLGFLMVDATRIYWGMGATVPGVGGIQAKAKWGGATVDIVTGLRVFATALSDRDIFFASPDDGGKILRVKKTGGPITTLASNVGPGLANVPMIALANHNVFFSQSSFGVECDGMVRFVPRTGGQITDVATEICHLIGLAADPTAVYWSEFDSATQTGRIMKMNAPYTGTPTVLDAVAIQPNLIAIDDAWVYYAATDEEGGGLIARVAKNGEQRQLLAEGQQLPLSVAVDRRHVYWTTVLDGEVKRVAK